MLNQRHYRRFSLGASVLALSASVLNPVKDRIQRYNQKVHDAKVERRKQNALGRIRNAERRQARRERFPEDIKRQKQINKMTNWQNHQWMKDGSKPDKIGFYLKAVKPSRGVRIRRISPQLGYSKVQLSLPNANS